LGFENLFCIFGKLYFCKNMSAVELSSDLHSLIDTLQAIDILEDVYQLLPGHVANSQQDSRHNLSESEQQSIERGLAQLETGEEISGSSDFLAQNALSTPPQTTPLSRMGLIVSDLAPFLLKGEELGLGACAKITGKPKKAQSLAPFKTTMHEAVQNTVLAVAEIFSCILLKVN
jgi:hypothetical protein